MFEFVAKVLGRIEQGRLVSLGLLLLRCAVGAALMVHGYGKFVDVEGFAKEFGIALPMAYAATLTQLGAGAAVVVGAGTVLGAAALGGTMLVATAQLVGRGEVWINPHGHSFEASLFYLVGCLVVGLCGPGRYSVDGVIWGRVPGATR